MFDLLFSTQIKRLYLQPVQEMTLALKKNFNKISFAKENTAKELQGYVKTWEADGQAPNCMAWLLAAVSTDETYVFAEVWDLLECVRDSLQDCNWDRIIS